MDSVQIPPHDNPLWKKEAWFDNHAMEYCHCYLHHIMGNLGLHSNEFMELNIVMSGSALHRIGCHTYDAQPGCVYVVPSGVQHGYTTSIGAIIFHALILDDFFCRYDKELRLLPGYTLLFEITPFLQNESNTFFSTHLTHEAYDSISSLIQAILGQEKLAYAGREIFKNASLLSLIAELSRFTDNINAKNNVPAEDVNSLIIARSMEYIRLNAQNKIAIDDLARDACMARSTFMRNFHRVCHQTPMQFLLQCRLDIARKMLCYSTEPITDVALECGFYDTSHFIHVFTKYAGCTPTDFRALYSKNASYSACGICL